MSEIVVWDYILLPLYLLGIYMIAYAIRNAFYREGHPLRKYFIPGLTVKIVGAIFIGLVYHYYYKGGDTFDYFFHIKLTNGSLSQGFGTWLRVISNSENMESLVEANIATQKYYVATDTVTVWQITSVIALFCFSLYLPLSAILAFLSFLGTWQIFRFFNAKFPNYTNELAFTTLFIPTTVIWGSGLFKDTICQMAIGFALISVYNISNRKHNLIANVLILIIAGLLLYKIKIYIFASFIPLVIVWGLSETIVVSKRKRLMAIFSGIVIIILFLNTQKIIDYFIADTSKYALANISEYSIRSKDYLLSRSNETDGSSFDIGEYEPSFAGLLSKFGPAVNATLFRPYIWESRKVLVFLSALQSLFAFILTITVLYRILFWRKLSLLFNNTIFFCLLFSIIFAFMIGISTSNFGSLSRYKIPLEPFLYSALIILYRKSNRTIS
jgi:hypothetical protein